MREQEWDNRGTKAIRALTEQSPQYRQGLFTRGYLITDDRDITGDEYPFFGLWEKIQIKKWAVWLHPALDHHVFQMEGSCILLLGHAYDPFHEEYLEEHLLAECGKAIDEDEGTEKDAIFQCIYDWTGVFALFYFNNDQIIAVQDCGGIKAVCYGSVRQHRCLTSHPQLVADLYQLAMDPKVKKLVSTRFYHIGNRFLPGDLSPYKELKRLAPNHYLVFGDHTGETIGRFYPQGPHKVCHNKAEYEEIVQKTAEIIHKNIELCLKKWPRTAISLSGGVDSQTTLSCANGLYSQLQFFSFQSKESEEKDSQTAHEICGSLGIPHKIYDIPKSNDEIEGFDQWKSVIVHSYGYIRGLKDSEIRKHIYMYLLNDFDTEIKSWMSEVARVFYDRKYGIRMPGRFSARHFSVLQTRFLGAPSLLHWADMCYRDWMKRFQLEGPIFNFECSDLHYWEVRMGNWGMMVTQSLDLCHRLTFPYNNRHLLEIMLSAPRESREKDLFHKDIICVSNPEIHSINKHVHNAYFSRRRIWMEKLYYYYRTMFHH